MTRTVKQAFKYRFYPTDAQAAELARTFGCVRKVYNLALAARTDAGLDHLLTLSTGEKIIHRLRPRAPRPEWCGPRTCRCGTVHDRDVNGAGVRPQRADARTRRSATKQEPPGATQGIPRL